MKKMLIALIVVVAIIVVGTWFSGYNYAQKLVGDKAASLVTVNYVTESMNTIKKSGFMYYIENRTDYNQQLKNLTTFSF